MKFLSTNLACIFRPNGKENDSAVEDKDNDKTEKIRYKMISTLELKDYLKEI